MVSRSANFASIGRPKPKHDPRQKLLYIAIATLLWLALIGARLVWVQVFRYSDYMHLAARQQQRTFEISPRRGNIYDRNGNPLAVTVDVHSIFAVPSEIPDKATTAAILGKVLKIDAGELLRRFDDARNFTWVARKIDDETTARVVALNLKGIGFEKEAKRFYPKNGLAAQVLGYVGMDDKGLAGVELENDESLHGIEGRSLIMIDAKRRGLGRVQKDPEPGENIVLTLDEKIQYIAEREIDTAMEQTHAEAATIVVQNSKTGEILALASRPTFDPNAFGKLDPKSLRDRAVSDVYEPGSTFKMVTIAAAIDQHVTRPDEAFDCQMGQITFNGYRIHDWHPFGVLTVAGILAHSSDVGAIKIGLRLGEERMYRYIRAFGFGTKTGIELPGESRGMTKPVNRWSAASIGSISMGQEIAVTPLQLVSMTSTMANDGIYTPPRIVLGVAPPGGSAKDVKFAPPEQHRVISERTAAEMRGMLEGVVEGDGGTGHKAQLNGWTAAGKTGTAQKIDPKTHRYGSKDIASFSGFAPANDPAITVSVILDSPAAAHHHGGDTAAPVFSRVVQQTLAYLNVPHDLEVNQQKAVLTAKESMEEGPSQRLGSLDFSDPEIAAMNEPETTADQGHVVAAAYTAPRPKPDADTDFTPLLPPTEDPVANAPSAAIDAGAGTVVDVGGPAVPSFAGKTLRAALESAEQSGVELQVVGSGLAQQQSPAPGAHLHSGERVVVWFRR